MNIIETLTRITNLKNMNSTTNAVTYSLYRVDNEGKYSVAITYEWQYGTTYDFQLISYHRNVSLTKCLEVIENRCSEDTKIPDDFENSEVRYNTYMIDDFPVASIQSIDRGRVITATNLGLEGLRSDEITLLEELHNRETCGK